MNETMYTLSESDLQAYVDGQLDPMRLAEVEAWLAVHQNDAERVAAYRKQNRALHALFDPVLNEAVPQRLSKPERKPWGMLPPLRYAAVAAWLVIGGTLGWFLHDAQEVQMPAGASLARQAAMAHAIYTPEVRHPVEVGADQEAHLDHHELGGAQLQVGAGEVLGEREAAVESMLPAAPVGQRLTLYVRTDKADNRETAFRYAREENVGVFYWIDGPFGYALSGDLEKPELMRVAQLVYQQLNP